MRRVVLHIDRLVLTGIGHEARLRLATGLRSELARLLQDPRAIDRMAALDGIPRLRIPPVAIARDAGPERIGARTARAIARAGRR